jgi:hypothetical protein
MAEKIFFSNYLDMGETNAELDAELESVLKVLKKSTQRKL